MNRDYLPGSWDKNFLYFLWNRSTRPAESINFCFPVKNGWHFEQISILILFFVERVGITSPHAHVMVVSKYSGCRPFFMTITSLSKTIIIKRFFKPYDTINIRYLSIVELNFNLRGFPSDDSQIIKIKNILTIVINLR